MAGTRGKSAIKKNWLVPRNAFFFFPFQYKLYSFSVPIKLIPLLDSKSDVTLYFLFFISRWRLQKDDLVHMGTKKNGQVTFIGAKYCDRFR